MLLDFILSIILGGVIYEIYIINKNNIEINTENESLSLKLEEMLTKIDSLNYVFAKVKGKKLMWVFSDLDYLNKKYKSYLDIEKIFTAKFSEGLSDLLPFSINFRKGVGEVLNQIDKKRHKTISGNVFADASILDIDWLH